MNPRSKRIYRVGDMVRIKAGPFAAFSGKVEVINQSKSLLKVAVEIFGRVTPVKVSFSEAEKLEFGRPLPPRSTQN
jgi:transcriptional antiterminator NusG